MSRKSEIIPVRIELRIPARTIIKSFICVSVIMVASRALIMMTEPELTNALRKAASSFRARAWEDGEEKEKS